MKNQQIPSSVLELMQRLDDITTPSDIIKFLKAIEGMSDGLFLASAQEGRNECKTRLNWIASAALKAIIYIEEVESDMEGEE